MLINKQQSHLGVQELDERPRGWSYACLESTIKYYMVHYGNHTKIKSNKIMFIEGKAIKKAIY